MCTNCNQTRLNNILDQMEVPGLRRSDLRWLGRNLHINNGDHPLLEEALHLVKKLSFPPPSAD